MGIRACSFYCAVYTCSLGGRVGQGGGVCVVVRKVVRRVVRLDVSRTQIPAPTSSHAPIKKSCAKSCTELCAWP